MNLHLTDYLITLNHIFNIPNKKNSPQKFTSLILTKTTTTSSPSLPLDWVRHFYWFFLVRIWFSSHLFTEIHSLVKSLLFCSLSISLLLSGTRGWRLIWRPRFMHPKPDGDRVGNHQAISAWNFSPSTSCIFYKLYRHAKLEHSMPIAACI